METKELVIDNRFRIQADTHLLTDLSSHTTTRLEPRLMKLLFLLATHAGQLVSREQIIRDIWNDYGGGEDGLTQAISFLRKMLDDVAKDRIRTIPKKGYLLNASVTPADNITEAEEKEKISIATHPPAEEEPVPALAEKKKSFWTHPAAITLAVLLPVCVLIAGRKTFFPSPVKSREPAGAVEDTLYQYQELKEQQQQQSANP
ncbi:MAG: winged helix-turn-helix domain-containing protein [Chitinophagaceae bacterium]|nr:winged helix-turn-helix domain-containing protein [Chitinophagaceae bacterium]